VRRKNHFDLHKFLDRLISSIQTQAAPLIRARVPLVRAVVADRTVKF